MCATVKAVFDFFCLYVFFFFFFKQKTAYEIYQCDWSSDVCSSDLNRRFIQRIDIFFLIAIQIRHSGTPRDNKISLTA